MFSEHMLAIGKLYTIKAPTHILRDFDAYDSEATLMRIGPDIEMTLLILDYKEDINKGVWIKVLYKDVVGWIWVGHDIDTCRAFIQRWYVPCT